MSPTNKTTHKRELFFVILLLALVSIIYQFYTNVSFRRVNSKKANIGRDDIITCPPIPDNEKTIEDILIFPALQNFSVEENVGPRFGQFPLQAKEVLEVHNFTDRELFAYMPAMTKQEKLVSLYVFQMFINICNQHNITYFIQGGTLLGAYRHHGFVPWDDDIDVYVDSKDKYNLFCSLKKAFPTFDVRQYPRFQWKFYYTKTKTLPGYRYRWPFIDIFFYSVEGETIFDVTYASKTRAFKSKNVLPLRTTLFEGAYLPAPCNLKHSMNALGFRSLQFCHTGSYIHKLERTKNKMIVKSAPCKNLYDIYPFVFQTKQNITDDRVEEVLKVGSKVLYTVIVKIGCTAKKAEP